MKQTKLFEILFTHKEQYYDPTVISSIPAVTRYSNFVNLLKTINNSTEITDHGFYFLVSNAQPTGSISITGGPYSGTLTTPLDNNTFTSNVDTNLINPLFIQSEEYTTISYIPNMTVLSSITVDSNYVNTSSTNFSDIYSSPSTVDTTNYIFYIDESFPINVDNSSSINSDFVVSIDGVKDTNVEVSWTAGSYFSKLHIPTSFRGYLPATSIGNSTLMSTISLKEVAVSIINLISTQQDNLLSSVLQELTYIWANNTSINKNSLPSTLYRYNDTYSYTKTRNTFDIAFLGNAIVLAFNYLRDRTEDTIVHVPFSSDLFLINLVDTVIKLTNEPGGYVSIGVDTNGDIIDTQDTSSLIMVLIFLHNYLSINYSEKAHAICSNLYEVIFNTKITSINNVNDLIIKLFYNILYKNHSDTAFIVSQIQTLIAQYDTTYLFGTDNGGVNILSTDNGQVNVLTNGIQNTYLSLNDFNLGLWLLCSKYLIALNLGITLVQPILLNVYKSKTNQPSIYYSTSSPGSTENITATSWFNILNNNNTVLINSPTFNIYENEAVAHFSYNFLESKRLMPFGRMWSSEEAATPYKGNLGALLYAVNSSTKEWYLPYKLITDGNYLAKSQGYSLDNWGALVNLPRPLFQSDNYYKNIIQYYINRSQSTLASLNFVLGLYTPTYTIKELAPTSYIVNNQTFPYKELLSEGLESVSNETISNIVNGSQVITDLPMYPTSTIISNNTTQITRTWGSYFPRLLIIVDTPVNGLDEIVSSEISAGIKTDIFFRQYYYIIAKSISTSN
jgi:hypothetical protein